MIYFCLSGRIANINFSFLFMFYFLVTNKIFFSSEFKTKEQNIKINKQFSTFSSFGIETDRKVLDP